MKDSSDKNFKITKAVVDKPTVTLSCTPASFSENGGKATCVLKLSKATAKDVTVHVAFSGNPYDYDVKGGTATFVGGNCETNCDVIISAGRTSKIFTITGKVDGETEGDEISTFISPM